MSKPTPRELMHEAMRLGTPERVPVMCQLAIGHTLIQTRTDPADFLLSSEVYADALLAVRGIYEFDGILIHKPGRDTDFSGMLDRVDRGGAMPVVHLADGSAIECPWNDDPIYRPAPHFFRPSNILEIEPEDPLAWAPPGFVAWCHHKGTGFFADEASIPPHWFDCIDRVLAAVGDEYDVHGEVRSPFDHLLNIAGMQDGLMALLEEPEHCEALMEPFTRASILWAVAQVRRGCSAIKISSPYAGAGFISRAMYQRWIMPSERRVAEAVRAAGGFVYTHTCGAIGDRLDLMMETGINGIETLDPPPLGTLELADAKRRLRDRLFIKGNVDPVNTILRKPRQEAARDVARTYEVGRQGGQFILSTACSVSPAAPRENVRLLAECVHGRL